ncbi:MAG: response regulator transcription factor [Xanthomonadales bacterium]|nr:response regulator transcription factor [Xanthomonadales bacterium]ODU91772.1 MAG: DNA-binding response regulator [Rhodanobacter sp. SCN 66-43]OJY82702.1 MAG: DNA-binding response regulator [Xanthomonadales bacterium 66-474]
MRMLVVEDDAAIADAVCDSLQRAGHVVDHLADGRAAMAALQEHAFALVVLDLGLPGESGSDVLRRLRSAHDGIPVLVITAREEVDLRVRTLDLGADDYLVKPFSLAEFDARVRALLRRQSNSGVPTLQLGKLSIDLAGRRVLLDDQPLELTAREFALLEVLASRRNRVTSREHVIEALCTWNDALTDNGLDIAVHRLRRKLADSGINLRTVRGLGYLLEADDGP